VRIVRHENLAVYAATLLLIITVKLFYANAEAEDLQWILYPTTQLVHAFLNTHFYFDAGNGYVAVDAPVIIGSGCAGLNFYVIALAMCVFSFVHHFKRHKWWFLVTAMGLIYLLTIVANVSRIIAAMLLLELGAPSKIAPADTLHTIQGTIFYFTYLVMFYFALQTAIHKRDQNEFVH